MPIFKEGDVIAIDNTLYKVISAIATGSTITIGTNVTATTVTDEVDDLSDDVSDLTTETNTLKSALHSLTLDEEELREITFGNNINVLDLDDFPFGYLNALGEVDTSDTGAHTTNFLPVGGNYITHSAFIDTVFGTQQKPIRCICFYDSNKQFISRDQSNTNSYAMVSNAAYVRCSLSNGYLYGMDMLTWEETANTNPSKWIPHRNKALSEYNALYGCSLVCFGDSICRGENWTSNNPVYPNDNSGWAQLLRDWYNMQVYGYGISGATIRKITDNTNSVYEQFATFVYRATNSNYVPDYILIEGGINDATRYYNGTDTDVDFGSLVDGYGQSNDYTTTIGALERMFYTAKVTFPETKILYILPHHCSGDTFQTALKKYIEGIKTVCDKWSIPYIDLYTKGRLNGCITALRSAYFDEWGVHPNEEGYKIMTNDIEKIGLLNI